MIRRRIEEVENEKRQLVVKIGELEAKVKSFDHEIFSLKGSYDSQLKAQQVEIDRLIAAPPDRNHSDILNLLNDVKESFREKIESYERQISDLKKSLDEANEKAAAVPPPTPVSEGLSEGDVKAFMQDIYSKAVEVFNDDDAALSTSDIIKRLKAVLKAVTTERLNK